MLKRVINPHLQRHLNFDSADASIDHDADLIFFASYRFAIILKQYIPAHQQSFIN